MTTEGTTMTTKEWQPDICLYHGGCTDGFASAWAVWKRWGDAVQYIPMSYGDALADKADVAGKHVLMVDFSLKREAMIDAAGKAASIVVLDHHKTAEKELSGFARTAKVPEPADVPVHLDRAGDEDSDPYDRVLVHFDMEKSGARLAWEFCHPDKPIPRLLEHIEDRDLWRFALEGTKEVTAALRSYDLTFDLLTELATGWGVANLGHEGRAILRMEEKRVSEFVSHAYLTEVGGHPNVPVVNVPYQFASDVGHAVLKAYSDAPFAGTWARTKDGKIAWSLRSEDSREDVAAIAASFGGGGHRNASGFSIVAPEIALAKAHEAEGRFKCGARPWESPAGGGEPQDCNWPTCGCDPHAIKVIEALQESGLLPDPSSKSAGITLPQYEG